MEGTNMKRFTWDRTILNELLQERKKILELHPAKKIRIKLETEIEHLEYLLHLPQSTIDDEYGTEEDFANDSPGKKESSAHMLYQNYVYFYEAEEDKEFPVVARNLYYPLSAIDPPVSNQFVSVKRSNTALAEMVVDCFSKVDPNLASFSKKVLFAKNPTIELHSLPSEQYDLVPEIGCCYFYPELPQPYCILYRNQNVFDFTSLAHELGHLYRAYMTGYDRKNFCDNYYFQESEGIFLELIALHQATAYGYPLSDVQNRIRFYFLLLKNATEDLMVSHLACGCAHDHPYYLSLPKLNRSLQENKIPLTIQKQNIYGYLDFDYEESLINIHSFLEALDLFNLYQKDPEKAFYLFQQSFSLPDLPLASFLEKTECHYHEDQFDSMKKLIKKIEPNKKDVS